MPLGSTRTRSRSKLRSFLLHVHAICLLLAVSWVGRGEALGDRIHDASSSGTQGEREEHNPGDYLNSFAVKLRGREERDVAEAVAAEHGFRLKAELPHSKIFIFEHPEVRGRIKRSSAGHLESLQNDPRIAHAQQEVLLKRVKRRIIHDKQEELPIRSILDSSVYKRMEAPTSMIRRNDVTGGGRRGDDDDDCCRDRPKFKDPYFKDMWYLVNQGQSGGERGLDLNVGVVWQQGITGKGVVVTILDDGVDHTHPDLKDNYDPDASTDLNDKHDISEDPMPDTSDDYNSHGTRCAGEVAAVANNYVCGVGVAYEARIGGVRVLDGPVVDSLEAEAFSFNRDYIDIYSASWGPADDGTAMEGPRHLSLTALKEGVAKGRKGLGSIFVWATGNGGMYRDDCSADGYVSRPETLSVGAVNDWGRSPFFTENCSSTMAVVPSGGEDYLGQEEANGEVKLKVVTTDMSGGCIENFQGTSSAAPLAAGCLANVLQANPSLTWRDVQHIVVQGTRVPYADASWTINGAGRHVSHKFGFGLMDCARMVGLAQDWRPVPERHTCNTTRKSYSPLRYNSEVSDVIMSDGCRNSDDTSEHVDRLEHVEVYLKMTTEIRGDVAVFLVSPAGTRSAMLSPRPLDVHSGEWEFTFMTVHNWDESSRGRWTLEVHHRPHKREPSSDETSSESRDIQSLKHQLDEFMKEADHSDGRGRHGTVVGYVREWSLTLYGTHGTRHGRTGLIRNRKQAAFKPSADDVAEIRKKEVRLSREVKVKRMYPTPTDGGALGHGMNSQTSSGSGSSGNEELDDLREKIWKLLHSNGARDFRKRILKVSKSDSREEMETKRQEQSSRVKKSQEVIDLAQELLDILEHKRSLRL